MNQTLGGHLTSSDDSAGAVVSALAALGGELKTEELCEGIQRVYMMRQQTGEAAQGAQQQLLELAERHAAGLTGQVNHLALQMEGRAAPTLCMSLV